MLIYYYSPAYKLVTPDNRDAIDVVISATRGWKKSKLVQFLPGYGENQIYFEFGTLDEGVIAHTYLPDDDNRYARIVLSQAVDWNLSLGWWRLWAFSKGIEMLEDVIGHEVGHVLLGAGHAPDNVNSVMVHNDARRGIYQAPSPTKWDFEELKKRV
jgi:hypothetical protein